MERRKSEEFTDVLLRYLRQSGLETPLNEHRVMAIWPEVAGEVVGEVAARLSEASYIRNQTLHVRVRSAVLRQELVMQRTRLVRELNERVQAQVVTDISFE